MAGLVETDQQCSRSRNGSRNRSSTGSSATGKRAGERKARKELETKRRTARANFRARLGSTRHEGGTKTHAAWSVVIRVAYASRVLAMASRDRPLLLSAPETRVLSTEKCARNSGAFRHLEQ